MVFNPGEFSNMVCLGATHSDCTGATERTDVEVGRLTGGRGRLRKLRLIKLQSL